MGFERDAEPVPAGSRGMARMTGGLWRRAVLVAAAAALLVACGGEEAPEDQGDDPESAAASEEPAEEEPVAAPEEDEPADAEGADEEPTEEGGLQEHRPAEDAESFADCGSIDEDAPGAVIRFPDDGSDAGDGPVTVEVVGCGNTFEANVQWEAYHGNNTAPTLEGHTMGGTMGDWGAFSITETYWTPGDWTVVVFEIDAESGDRVEYDEVTFTVG